MKLLGRKLVVLMLITCIGIGFPLQAFSAVVDNYDSATATLDATSHCDHSNAVQEDTNDAMDCCKSTCDMDHDCKKCLGGTVSAVALPTGAGLVDPLFNPFDPYLSLASVIVEPSYVSLLRPPIA